MVQNLDDAGTTGAIVIVVAAIFTILCLSSILLHILFVLIAPPYARHMASTRERNFITSPLGFYVICVLAGNYVTSVGGILELKWIGSGVITDGQICTTQAILLQLGNNATALWIGVLSIAALQTFVFRARPWPKYVTLPLIAFLWVLMIAFEFTAPIIFKHSPSDLFYGPTGPWCWITPKNPVARMAMQYGWMGLWSFVGIVCFLFVFFSVRRVKADGSNFKWRSRSSRSYDFGNDEELSGDMVGGVSKTLSFFPVSYIILTFPLFLTQFFDTYNLPVPTYVFTFVAAVSFLLGTVNSGLYFAIRHSLKHAALHNETTSEAALRHSSGQDKTDAESFETPEERRASCGNILAYYSETSAANSQTYPSSSIVYGANNGANGAPLCIYGTPASRPITKTLASVRPRPGLTPLPSFRAIPRYPVFPSIAEVSELSPKQNDSLTSGLQTVRQRPSSDASVYSSLRSISLYTGEQEEAIPTTLLPPPRKGQRSPVPNVPLDVDETDEGSVCSTQPIIDAFKQDENLPMSPGDVATRNPRRADSTRTFWTYEEPSPISPNMPMPPDTLLRRETMQSMWTEERSPNGSAFSDVFPIAHKPTINSSHDYSGVYKQVDPSVFRQPSTFSTVGKRQTRQENVLSPPLMTPEPRPISSMMSPPATSSSGHMARQQHRRSRSLASRFSPSAPIIPLVLTPGARVSRQAFASAMLSGRGRTPRSDYCTPQSQAGYL